MKIILLTNSDWALWHFRLPLAKALRDMRWEVILMCPPGTYVPRLEKEEFRVIPWQLNRRSLNPIKELMALKQLLTIYHCQQPTLVHHFTIKPNIYGTLAAVLSSVPHVINTWTGLGWTFSEAIPAKALRTLLLPLMRWLFHRRNVWTVFLNEKDLERFEVLRLTVPLTVSILRSEGVDTECFHPKEGLKPQPPIVLMAARLLWDKGVKEFVEAARQLKEDNVQARFWVAGTPDPANPRCIPQKVLETWRHTRTVEFLGHREDMPYLLQQASIAVLPSYYEGIPLFLLEAMASGVPVVATGIPGCRAIVEDGVNGLLVPPRDSITLAKAIKTLLSSPKLREEMGQVGREIAVSRFETKLITHQWLKIYEKVLNR